VRAGELRIPQGYKEYEFSVQTQERCKDPIELGAAFLYLIKMP